MWLHHASISHSFVRGWSGGQGPAEVAKKGVFHGFSSPLTYGELELVGALAVAAVVGRLIPKGTCVQKKEATAYYINSS